MYDDDNPYDEEYKGRKYPGKYKGFVRDNADPENRGRVRCYCPQVMGDEDNEQHWLGWAEPCLVWLGGIDSGDLGPPLTGKEQVEENGREYYGVWLEFEEEDPDFPIWVGCFTIAPTATDSNAHTQGTEGGAGQVGGGIIGHGGDDQPLNPPQSLKLGREIRLRAKKGRDIILGVEGGGYIVVGPHGVHLVGIQVTANGQPFFASVADIGGGT